MLKRLNLYKFEEPRFVEYVVSVSQRDGLHGGFRIDSRGVAIYERYSFPTCQLLG